MTNFRQLQLMMAALPGPVYRGTVVSCAGQTIRVRGLERMLSAGDRCEIRTRDRRRVPCEVIGFDGESSLLMPFESADGIVLGARVEARGCEAYVKPHRGWIGRVVNGLGEPIDGKGPLPQGDEPRRFRSSPPSPYERRRLGPKLDTGVRALNVFAPICRGQRIGVFSGSGVGKSTLLSMLARGGGADVAVIGLIGERGREVQEFLQETLGEDGLKSTVMVVATSDESPQMRRQATYLTLAIAEAFRDMGMQALCLVDSITRFAMAQREIGLTAGEPPTSKGYPPSVFSEMAKLLERAGPGGGGQGDITAIFTVLAEGDDHNDPIADAARSILDGHIVLERSIAERGRFPAIDILKSVSRALPGCHSAEEYGVYREARRFLSAYEEMRELIRLGAYKAGSDPVVDRAIGLEGELEAFLAQTAQESVPLDECFTALSRILGMGVVPDEEVPTEELFIQAEAGEGAGMAGSLFPGFAEAPEENGLFLEAPADRGMLQ